MPAKRRSTRAKKPSRRQQLLEHARALIARQGFAATNLEQIAEAAGVKPSIVTRSFKDKPGLVFAVAREFGDRLIANPTDMAESLAKLNGIVEAIRKDLRQPASPSRVLLRMLAEAPDKVVPAIDDALEPGFSNLATLIQAGQAEGVFRRTLDPRHTAWELLRSLFGLALLDGLEPAPITDPDHPPTALECMFQGLLKTDV